MAQMVRPQHASRDLRMGLFIALDRESATYQSKLRGNGQTGRGNGNAARPVSRTHDELLTAVVALKDSVAIPVLANSLGTGMTPVRALVEFGPTAVASTLRVTNASASEHEQVADGLLTLRLIVENAALRPLTPSARARVHDAAASRLNGAQSVDVLERAIDLGVVLGDADLRLTVEKLASSGAEVEQRGIPPNRVAQVQRIARQRLDGVPAQPRR